MDSALDPLDLVKHSARIAEKEAPTVDAEALSQCMEEIAQEAVNLVNADPKEEFLYKNPNGWHVREHKWRAQKKPIRNASDSSSSSISFSTASSSTSSGEYKSAQEPWSSIEDYEFYIIVRQISEFIKTWELSPETKFVVIGLNKTEDNAPFGKKNFVEAHFSKPTPKCPNPLPVAKVYFQVNVSYLLPKDYPVKVIYRFEGYQSQFYVMDGLKLDSNKFQRHYIDSILHMKLAFYAQLCECRNPLNPLIKRVKSGILVTLRGE